MMLEFAIKQPWFILRLVTYIFEEKLSKTAILVSQVCALYAS